MKYSLQFIILFLFAALSLSGQSKSEQGFSIIAIGDMPYFLPDDYARFENLIKAINEQGNSFTVHVGDIKSSNTPCTEDYYNKIYNYFEAFKKPLIYTPGDNEWTDCNKVAAGAYDPEERLAVIRKLFFKDKNSFGKEKMTTAVQSDNPIFTNFVENRRWDLKGVTFGTVHLVGTNNFFLPESKNFNREFFERDDANVAWLHEIFKHANQIGSPGVFIFTQADMFSKDKAASGCFDRFLRELKKLAIEFKKPVVLVNGDSHKFIVDKPLVDESTKKVIANFTRIQVFGEYDMHAVKINIDPGTPSLFQVEQFLVNGN